MSLLDRIAEGTAGNIRNIGATIDSVGRDLKEDRLLKIANQQRQEDRQLQRDQLDRQNSRQDVADARSAFTFEQQFNAGNALELSTIEDPSQALEVLQRQRGQAESLGISTAAQDEAIQMLQAGDIEGFKRDIRGGIDAAYKQGILKAPAQTGKYTSTHVTEDGGLIGVNRNTGASGAIDLGGVRLKGSAPTVNITNEAEGEGLTEEQKALGKARVTRFTAIQEAANNAIDQDEQLAQLENIDIETGFGVETRGRLASVINAVAGQNVGDDLLDVNLPALQAFKGVSKRLVNSELNKAKGPQTEGDAKRAEQTIASLGNEQVANKFIIKSLRATNARRQEQALFYERVLERDGSLKNADKEWAEFKRKTPMLSASVLDKETGLPMFYNEFREKALANNPGAEDNRILSAWREMQ